MFGILSSLAAAGHHAGRTRYPAGYRKRSGYSFHPHNGEREIARRLAQDEQRREAQRDRYAARFGHREAAAHPDSGLSRRGRFTDLS